MDLKQQQDQSVTCLHMAARWKTKRNILYRWKGQVWGLYFYCNHNSSEQKKKCNNVLAYASIKKTLRFYITFFNFHFYANIASFFSHFFLLLMTYRFEHDLELQYVQKQTNMLKKKKPKKKIKRPLCFDVIAKCYKRHRFLPSATLWALSILPQWHLCLPFTRIIHRYSERS